MTLPELTRNLEDLENQKFTQATIKYEKVPPNGKRKHRVKFVDLAAPWDGRQATDNRLEPTWWQTPRIGDPRKGKPVLFPVDEKEIVDSDTVRLKWTVWFKAD